jgi:hypothetical protein
MVRKSKLWLAIKMESRLDEKQEESFWVEKRGKAENLMKN